MDTNVAINFDPSVYQFAIFKCWKRIFECCSRDTNIRICLSNNSVIERIRHVLVLAIDFRPSSDRKKRNSVFHQRSRTVDRRCFDDLTRGNGALDREKKREKKLNSRKCNLDTFSIEEQLLLFTLRNKTHTVLVLTRLFIADCRTHLRYRV